MKEILFLEPVFKTMVWGGNKLKSEFGFEIPSDQTGECWAISAHQNGDCTITKGVYQGKPLSWLWNHHRELFGNQKGEVFPLLIKIIDAKGDLSIQVHPDDEYAKVMENGALGKTECWYILDCEENSEIVIGHNAKDKNELKEMISQNRWGELLKIQPIKKGDFFQIEPGTVHAIKTGTLILETQQNSDITYRLYDYDRLDHGKPRELHLEKSIDVIRCPHKEGESLHEESAGEAYRMVKLVECDYYTVEKIILEGEQIFEQNKSFLNVTVISGEGTVDDNPIKKGDCFILPDGYGQYCLSGNMELMISYL